MMKLGSSWHGCAHGTLLASVLVSLSACDASKLVPAEGLDGSVQQERVSRQRAQEAARSREAAAALDAASVGCDVASDCELVLTASCGLCVPAASAYGAVLRGRAEEITERYFPPYPGCGACWRDPDVPLYGNAGYPECVNGRCRVVDLTLTDLTECSTDSDCHPVAGECCPTCGSPVGVLVVSASTPSGPLTCLDPPCSDGSCDAAELAPFCSESGRCSLSTGTQEQEDAGAE
jgi:hypothetical protein